MGFRRGADMSLAVEVCELMRFIERRAAREENIMCVDNDLCIERRNKYPY